MYEVVSVYTGEGCRRRVGRPHLGGDPSGHYHNISQLFLQIAVLTSYFKESLADELEVEEKDIVMEEF